MKGRERFSSRLGFILVSAGSAIGLGNVYRFPIWCGAYGGGLFLFFYLLFLVLLGLPVMTMELSVGRASRRSIATSFDLLEKKGHKWHWIKGPAIVGNYLLMSFYPTITCWFAIYFFRFLLGMMPMGATAPALDHFFHAMTGDAPLNMAVTLGVILACFGVCAMGLQRGVEKITRGMMLLLILLVLLLAGYSCALPGAGKGLRFFFVPSWHAVEVYGLGRVLTSAMSQAFFTLSLGMGTLTVFGSYASRDKTLMGESLTILCLDTFVSIMAGMIIFPAFFTFNPGVSGVGADQAGPGFLFSTLSAIFTGMAGGRWVGAAFFLFMIFACLTTLIAVFESIVSFWMEVTRLSRKKVVMVNAAILPLLSLPFIFSHGEGWLARDILPGRNLGQLLDFLVSPVILALGSLTYVLFCTSRHGWGMANYLAEVNAGSGPRMPLWLTPFIRWALPLVILALLAVSMA